MQPSSGRHGAHGANPPRSSRLWRSVHHAEQGDQKLPLPDLSARPWIAVISDDTDRALGPGGFRLPPCHPGRRRQCAIVVAARPRSASMSLPRRWRQWIAMPSSSRPAPTRDRLDAMAAGIGTRGRRAGERATVRQRLTAPHPYVATRAIQSAVRGREAEVLDRLGIDRQAGCTHIRCPYPDHTDVSPSWRFNNDKRRAYCTCIERSHSIFDVAAKMRGGDFEAAKLFVAEAIGRGDLIRARHPEACRYPSSAAQASSIRPSIAATMNWRAPISPVVSASPPKPWCCRRRRWPAGQRWRIRPPASSRRNAKPVHVGDCPVPYSGCWR